MEYIILKCKNLKKANHLIGVYAERGFKLKKLKCKKNSFILVMKKPVKQHTFTEIY